MADSLAFQPRLLYDDNFVPPAVRHSPTSVAAAEAIKPAAPIQRQRVLELLRGAPLGLTDEEVADVLNLNPSSARPRRIELLQAGAIYPAGTRKTRSGREAQVWKAVSREWL